MVIVDTLKKRSVDSKWLIFLSIIGLLCMNILYFIGQAASPHIRNDAWYFLETVIYKWHTVGFNISDIFIKRGLSDHAQPLNKIILFLNYRYSDLDFKIDALIGFLALVFIIIIFVWHFSKRSIENQLDSRSFWAMIGAVAILTSLNATEIYTWPLVTFGFVSLFFSIVIVLVAWQAIAGESGIVTILMAAALAILIGDTASFILWLSLSVPLTIFILRQKGKDGLKAIRWLLGSLGFLIVYFLSLNWSFLFFYSPKYIDPVSVKINWLDWGMYIEGVRLIFSSSLVFVEQYVSLGKYGIEASWLVAFFVFYYYVRYFVLLFKSRELFTKTKFLTTFILIYATISCAAIFYGRVPIFGIDYLAQPRYIFVYQLIPFALLLDYAYAPIHNRKNLNRASIDPFIVFTLALLALQLIYAVRAYKSVPWISMYIDRQVKEDGRYLLDRSLPTGDCLLHSSGLCRLSVGSRNNVLDILEKRRLNYLNPNFQWRYKIFPLDLSGGIEMPILKVAAWGPQSIGETSNQVGIWIKLEKDLFDVRRQIFANVAGQDVAVVLEGNLITFLVPKEISKNVGSYSIKITEKGSVVPVVIGKLEVMGG